ncbi:MAG: gas vesicle protein GvpJ [Nocardioidaceae bacterium]
MTLPAYTSSSTVDRPGPSRLEDVVDIILDRGMVIDAVAQVSLLGVEVLSIDARFVIASIDTYLRFAEAVDRLALGEPTGAG